MLNVAKMPGRHLRCAIFVVRTPSPAALLLPFNIEYEGPGEYKPRSMTCKHVRRLLRTFFRQQSPKSGSYGESLTHHACACVHRIIRPSCALRSPLPMSLPCEFQTAMNAWARLRMLKRMPCRCVQEPLELLFSNKSAHHCILAHLTSPRSAAHWTTQFVGRSHKSDQSLTNPTQKADQSH